MKSMKAGVIEGPRRLRLAEVPVPDVGPEDVLVKVRNVGICATDLEIYQGVMPYYLTGQASYPIIPGHEWSGEIVAVGSKVTGWKAGDRVVGEITISCGRCAYCLSGGYNMCAGRVEIGVMNQNGAAAAYMVYPALPVARVTSCVFGGPNRDELYITTARHNGIVGEYPDQPLAGGLFRVKFSGLKGAATCRYGAGPNG